jgi:V/A-type H+-transporting ATPase subunit A
MRIVKVFWALDAGLAYRRHFPSINWLTSYSLYVDTLKDWFDAHLSPSFMAQRTWALAVLQQEASLNEIVQLVGKDSLSPADQLTLETARIIREDFLQQNAFSDIDGYSSFDRQLKMMSIAQSYDKQSRAAIEKGVDIQALFNIPAREKIGRAKNVEPTEYEAAYALIQQEMDAQIAAIILKGGQDE